LPCALDIVHAQNRMRVALDELAPGNNIKLKLSEDGSGRGAAIVAAVACRLAAAGEYKT
jgi:hexokinase